MSLIESTVVFVKIYSAYDPTKKLGYVIANRNKPTANST